MNLLIVSIATILTAILYRLGGSAKNGSWYDWAKHSKTRDWGCTIVVLGILALCGKVVVWWWIFNRNNNFNLCL